MTTVNQIHQTTDYSMFQTLEGNRQLNKLHLRRLKNSFQKKYLLSPIIVNEKFEIIDGQHRFEAGKQLGLPINFLIAPNYGIKEVQILNENSSNWLKEDYLNAYCDLGYPEYLKFREFRKMFPEFGMKACECILTNQLSDKRVVANDMRTDKNKWGQMQVFDFKGGDMLIPDFGLAVENAKKIQMIKPFYSGYNRQTFVITMVGLFKVEHYRHDRFVDKLRINPTGLKHCVNVTQYKLLIEDIYNYKSKEKVSLRF